MTTFLIEEYTILAQIDVRLARINSLALINVESEQKPVHLSIIFRKDSYSEINK